MSSTEFSVTRCRQWPPYSRDFGFQKFGPTAPCDLEYFVISFGRHAFCNDPASLWPLVWQCFGLGCLVILIENACNSQWFHEFLTTGVTSCCLGISCQVNWIGVQNPCKCKLRNIFRGHKLHFSLWFECSKSVEHVSSGAVSVATSCTSHTNSGFQNRWKCKLRSSARSHKLHFSYRCSC